MKFALVVLLGLCAIAAQASVVRDEQFNPPIARSDITDAIREKIEEFIEKAKQEFEVIRQKVHEIAEKAAEDLHKIVEQGKAKFAEVVKNVEDKVEELRQKGGVFKACVEQHQAELEAIREEARADVNKCVEGAVESAKKFREAIDGDVEEIKKEIETVRGIIEECADPNVITAGKCVYGKLDEIKGVVKNIAVALDDATKIAAQKARETVSDAQECNHEAYAKASQKLQEIAQKVQKCYGEGQ